MTQPPSCSSLAPHSGQKRILSEGISALAALGPWVTGVRRSASSGWGTAPDLFYSIYRATLATTFAMASGQEVQLMPCWRMVLGQRMPLSWS